MDGLDRTSVRQGLIIRGQIQGVGFRPWVRQQASRLGLSGWVRNTNEGVALSVEGPHTAVQALSDLLNTGAAPGHITDIQLSEASEQAPGTTPRGEFRILDSDAQGPLRPSLAPDTAVCETCLSELFSADPRRWRHPFIHCPHCGPRYTTLTGWPFDRAHTTMADFAVCPDCEREYHSPVDRRSHDQTISCQHCGPRLRWSKLPSSHSPDDTDHAKRDPIAEALRSLRQGHIVAIQSTGGFHLCCDAQQPEAVDKLRRVKQRPHQPFALMCANQASADALAHISPHEATWLQHPGRPIVLLAAKPSALALQGVAPGLSDIGVMLPCSPLQYLLFHEAMGQPSGTAWLNQAQDLTLVMTSGNLHGAPLIKDAAEALQAFEGIADAVLWHDQPIAHRADDSVLRVRADGSACWLRKSRGWLPQTLSGPVASTVNAHGPRHILALGGDLKNTPCEWVSDGQRWQAWVGPHLGNLAHPDTRRLAHDEAQRIAAAQPSLPIDAIASDAHPDYASHRMAQSLAAQLKVSHQTVQHHVAHVAAVLAERGASPDRPVIAWVADGQGWGSDGQAWGGELLWMQGRRWQRIGHLMPIPLPGGDRAAREPWRLAAGVLHACGLGEHIAQRWPHEPQAQALQRWLQSGSVPHTSSLGRLFDAAAALMGLVQHSSYEAHAAMWLEAAAHRAPKTAIQPGPRLAIDEMGVLDWRPLMRHVAAQSCASADEQARCAAEFHETISHAMADAAIQACRARAVDTVILTGGCMANRWLDERISGLIQAQGLQVWRASQYPCGDGGLSLGQAWFTHCPPLDHDSTSN